MKVWFFHIETKERGIVDEYNGDYLAFSRQTHKKKIYLPWWLCDDPQEEDFLTWNRSFPNVNTLGYSDIDNNSLQEEYYAIERPDMPKSVAPKFNPEGDRYAQIEADSDYRRKNRRDCRSIFDREIGLFTPKYQSERALSSYQSWENFY